MKIPSSLKSMYYTSKGIKNSIISIANNNGVWIDWPSVNSLHYRYQFRPGKILEVQFGDIIEQEMDAIVNAANEFLKHSGGIAGRIATAAGRSLIDECNSTLAQRSSGQLNTTDVIATRSGNLKNCKYVLHAVGPRWIDGMNDEKALLARTIKNVLELAEEINLKKIAIPLISSNIFGMPLQIAVSIIVSETKSHLEGRKAMNIEVIRLVDFTQERAEAIVTECEKVLGQSNVSLHTLETPVANKIPIYEPEYIWKWLDSDILFKNYDAGNMEILDKAFASGKSYAELCIDSAKYKSGKGYYVIFGSMVQINMETKFKRRVMKITNVNRKPKNTKFNLNKTVEQVTLDQHEIAELLLQGLPRDVKKAQIHLQKLIDKNLFSDKVLLDRAVDIEAARASVAKFCVTLKDLGNHEILVSGMMPNVLRVISRLKDLGKGQKYPREWILPQQLPYCLIDISRESPEWIKIEHRINLTMDVKIVQIKRIQNKILWKKYQASKELIVMKRGKAEELELFHGTRRTNTLEIYGGDGFDMRFSTPGMWGIGSYFAMNASYSRKYASINGKYKEFFLANVLIGDVYPLRFRSNHTPSTKKR